MPSGQQVRHSAAGRYGRHGRRAGPDGVCLVPEGRAMFPNLTVPENLRRRVVRGPSQEAEGGVQPFPRLAERRSRWPAPCRAARSRCSPCPGPRHRPGRAAARRAVDGAGPVGRRGALRERGRMGPRACRSSWSNSSPGPIGVAFRASTSCPTARWDLRRGPDRGRHGRRPRRLPRSIQMTDTAQHESAEAAARVRRRRSARGGGGRPPVVGAVGRPRSGTCYGPPSPFR